MVQKRILAFSSSSVGDGGYLVTAVPIISGFLGSEKLNIVFIPFASVGRSYATYLSQVQTCMANLPYSISLAEPANAKQMIEAADVIMVGGGNTFKLLHDIYQYQLLDIIRDKIDQGIPFIGWSAGSNIVGPTIGTTNDMPVISPKSFNALGSFPFQINPHYTNLRLDGHNGETRDDRLAEFLLLNPGVPIVALPEGTFLKMENGILSYSGITPGILFCNENQVPVRKEIAIDENISFLL